MAECSHDRYFMKAYLLITGLMVVIAGCQTKEQPAPSAEEVINVLDEWHQAASDADFDTYFGLFANESSIFMGTDATERWDVEQFKDYARPYFDAGDAWDFTGHNRHIYFSKDGQVAWFDEELDTPNLGPSRGTGVLVKQSGTWKIAHYNLTVPIPNEIVYDVVQEIDSLSRSATD